MGITGVTGKSVGCGFSSPPLFFSSVFVGTMLGVDVLRCVMVFVAVIDIALVIVSVHVGVSEGIITGVNNGVIEFVFVTG
mgnify:CR=1 FL=1